MESIREFISRCAGTVDSGVVFLAIRRNDCLLGPASRIDDLRIRVINDEDFTHDV